MTAQEAISILQKHTQYFIPAEDSEAFAIAIEALEKRIPKECVVDSCPDHTHYECPSCGQIELSIYKHGFPRLGRITKYCENCGQALQMESDSVDK